MEIAKLIADVQGMTAIAVGLVLGMGALGTAIGFGLIGWKISGRCCSPTGNGPYAASKNVCCCRFVGRGNNDWCWFGVVLHFRKPIPVCCPSCGCRLIQAV